MRQFLFLLLFLAAMTAKADIPFIQRTAMKAKAEMPIVQRADMTDTLTQRPVDMPEELTVRQLFAEMPDSLLPYITRNNRLDCIDFMDSGLSFSVTNALDGKSYLTALTPDSLSMYLSEVSRVDMMLLTATAPVDSCQQVICFVRTYGLPEEFTESVVEWYSWRWERLDSEPPLAAESKQRINMYYEPSKVLNYYVKKLNKD